MIEPQPHLLIIFGGTGDLSKRKLLPAFYRLTQKSKLGGTCRVLGVGTTELSDDEYREIVVEALREEGIGESDARQWSSRLVFYLSITQGFDPLADRIPSLEDDHGLDGNRVFYLALPSAAVNSTLEGLGEHGLHQSAGWTRVVIEKPFGSDLESARELNRSAHRFFDESQIYRIDHYLGKETVQNLLVFRFGNALFEEAWNRRHVESVQITVAESVGVGDRAGYYDSAGALRDMVQSHLTQVMALVAMEPPVTMEADAIRDEKVKLVRAVVPPSPSDVVFGQYGPGRIEGEAVEGFLDSPGVAPGSNTETSVAMMLAVENWRWHGVPFALRTGKRFPSRLTEVVVTFRQPPISFFGQANPQPNVMVIRLQPEEGFELYFDVKAPGDGLSVETRPFRFSYEEAFGQIPAAYETLIHDIVTGDQTLFVRADEVEEAWCLYQPLITAERHVLPYPAGTWGPPEAERLLP